jgi:light-regulated signal transduction histidine kinase (bacteriophytochrome)
LLVSPRTHRWTSDQDLSEFLLRACHDLRSAMRAISAHTERLRKDGQAASDFEQRLGFIRLHCRLKKHPSNPFRWA